MNKPSRLLHSAANPAARALLEAGLPDAPRGDSARRAALALGLSASALATITSGTAGAVVGAGASLSVPAASSLLTIAAQWLAIGVVSGLGLVSGAAWITSPPSGPAPLAQARAASAVTSTIARTSIPPATSASTLRATDARASEVAGLAEAVPSARQNVRAALRGGPLGPSGMLQEPPDIRLAREVALIDEARRAIAAGSAQRALSTLDQYAAVDRTGTLDREAQILRIDALVVRGERKAAVALARSYLSAYPADPHAPKLQQVVDSAARGAR